jgi:hypothetical protein
MKLDNRGFLDSKKILVFLGLTIFTNSFGMSEMLDWESVKSFAGKFIVFNAVKPSYFAQAEDVRTLSSGLNAGHVGYNLRSWGYHGKGFGMRRLLGKKACDGNCALVDSKLQKYSLEMREATKEEMIEMLETIKNNEAAFDYHNNNCKMTEVLEQAIKSTK